MTGGEFAKIAVVLRYELLEALRSRLVLALTLLYGASTTVACRVLVSILRAAEEQLGAALQPGGGLDLVAARKKALLQLLSAVLDDPQLAAQLSAVDPVALFYAWGAMALGTPLALLVSAGAPAGSFFTKSVRFVFPRIARSSWALGQLAAHALLLLLAIAVGAAMAFAVSASVTAASGATALWLAGATLRAWAYAAVHLSLFVGLSLLCKTPQRARVAAMSALLALWVGEAWVDSERFRQAFVGSRWLALAFPAHYKLELWSPRPGAVLTALGALAALGAAYFAAACAWLARRDA